MLGANSFPHAIIQLQNCWKAYGRVQALRSIHLQIPAEKTTALIGPSGCGKSTILRLIIGLVRPDRGEIRFEGREMDLQDMPGLRHQMGYVIQNGGLFLEGAIPAAGLALGVQGIFDLAERYFVPKGLRLAPGE